VSLPENLKSLLYEIDHAHPQQQTEAVSIVSKWLQQRCEYRAIIHAERRRDIPTLERYSTDSVNANIRKKALEFLQNVRAGTLHNIPGGLIHNPAPESVTPRRSPSEFPRQ
jgi:hypothetical protein